MTAATLMPGVVVGMTMVETAPRLAAAKAEFDVEAMKKSNEALRQQALRNAVNVAPIPIPLAPTATQGQNTPFNGGY